MRIVRVETVKFGEILASGVPIAVVIAKRWIAHSIPAAETIAQRTVTLYRIICSIIRRHLRGVHTQAVEGALVRFSLYFYFNSTSNKV